MWVDKTRAGCLHLSKVSAEYILGEMQLPSYHGIRMANHTNVSSNFTNFQRGPQLVVRAYEISKSDEYHEDFRWDFRISQALAGISDYRQTFRAISGFPSKF